MRFSVYEDCHEKISITVDIYTDMQAIIEDCEADIPKFIKEVHPYDSTDAKMLMEMFQEEIDFQDEEREAERSDKER